MTTNLLVLGGTTEASKLAESLANHGVPATLSLAGRVVNPKPAPLPRRIGGFGGVEGLAAYLRDNAITHVIDATHPFAAAMSRNAVAACAEARLPLLALSRPPWQAQPGDDWRHVPDMAGAVEALAVPRKRVMLAVGRMHLADFAAQPQHHYLLRLVDPPETSLPLPNTTVIVDRGPFDLAGDQALLRENRIELVVSKNAGGRGAVAKIDAARALGLPVVMIDRPALPQRTEVHDVGAALRWLGDHGVDLGV